MSKNRFLPGFRWRHLPRLMAATFKAWNVDDPFRMSAVVAYYSILSLPALMIIIINTVGAIWGREIVQGGIIREISYSMGPDTAKAVATMISETRQEDKSLISSILGIATLLYGATGVFNQFQISFNKIWEVESTASFNFLKLVLNRIKSFGFILALGFLLLISFVLTSVISVLKDYINSRLPDMVIYVTYATDFVLSLSFISALFAVMFRFMPDTDVRWKEVWPGAILTALLFVIGKFLLSFYFGEAEPGSAYGAAGSIVLVLLWVFYSSLIVFFGAHFTKIYSDIYIKKTRELPRKKKKKEETPE